jgi:hypothetical protein
MTWPWVALIAASSTIGAATGVVLWLLYWRGRRDPP